MYISAQEIHEIGQIKDFADRVHAAARFYIKNGLYVIPVMPNGKSLPSKMYNIGYQHASKNKNTIDSWFGVGGRFRGFNLGIACGKRGGVFAVDIDVEDSKGNRGFDNLAILEEKYGKLVAPIQETPTGGRHYLFQWDKYAKSSSGKIAKAIDTRGGDEDSCKSHIVAWPSVRDEGEYAWSMPTLGDIPEIPKWISDALGVPWTGNMNRGSEEIDEDDLETRYTPRQIWRMLEYIDPDELEYDEWLAVLQAVHSQYPDDQGYELADRWSQRGARYKPDEVSIRWQSFDEHGTIRVGTLIYFAQKNGFKPNTEPKGAEEPSEDTDSVVAEYNKKFGVVMVGNKLRILMEQFNPDPFQDNFKLMSVQDFKALMANDIVWYGDSKGKSKPVQKSDIWFVNEKRREFVNGLTFMPDKPREVDGCFNVWEGWRYKEVAGDWSLFKKHVKAVVGSQEHYEWLMDWFADALQDPMNPKGCAVVMKGIEGTGKGTIANVFGELFGQHYKHIIQEEQLIGKFNGHLEEALLVFADEVTYGGNKKVAGTLKGLVTEKKLMIERKGLDATPYRNCLRLMIASNEDWFIPAGPHSRRWFVIDVPDSYASDKSYFDAIWKQMENGGYEAMMYELRNREIKSDLRKAPETKLLMEQRARYTTTDSVVEWWADKVEAGVIGVTGYEEFGDEVDWPQFVDKASLYVDYQEWCQANGAKRLTKPAFYAKVERDFKFVDCRPANPHGGPRKRMFEIMNHSACRALLFKMTGIDVGTSDTEE